MSGLCEEMKSRGVNLDWYDKRKHRPTATGPVPLDDAICSRKSIYMIKQDGSLWTVKSVVPCWSSAIRTRPGRARVGTDPGPGGAGLLLRQPPRDARHGPPGHQSHTRIQPEAAQLTLLPKLRSWSGHWREVTGQAAGPDPTSRRGAFAAPLSRQAFGCSPTSQDKELRRAPEREVVCAG
jgi:hypothetical protein